MLKFRIDLYIRAGAKNLTQHFRPLGRSFVSATIFPEVGKNSRQTGTLAGNFCNNVT